jgi:hypothetical protein
MFKIKKKMKSLKPNYFLNRMQGNRTNGLTTPKTIDSEIERFLNKHGIHGTPQYLPFMHISDSYTIRMCQSNCEAEKRRRGCGVVYGWLIWQDKRNNMITAEFHSVLDTASGLIDITPRVDGEKLVLFVPDSEKSARLLDDGTWETWANIESYKGCTVMETMKVIAGAPQPYAIESASKPFTVRFPDGESFSLVEEKDMASFAKEQESKGYTVINLFDLARGH